MACANVSCAGVIVGSSDSSSDGKTWTFVNSLNVILYKIEYSVNCVCYIPSVRSMTSNSWALVKSVLECMVVEPTLVEVALAA